MLLRPFFSFYGGKWRLAKRYPQPEHNIIIEPFAGSAGYSLRYPNKNIVLNDIDPVIYGVWQYLINVSSEEINKLPVDFNHIDEINVCQEAKWLIGFWLNNACTQPSKKPSSWMHENQSPCNFWGNGIKNRIINQLPFIRHWKIYNKPYNDIYSSIESTWFIDPPYNTLSGSHYKFSNINYDNLSDYCLNRKGQIIVCEMNPSNWLPFIPFYTAKSLAGVNGYGTCKELIYTNDKKWIDERITQ